MRPPVDVPFRAFAFFLFELREQPCSAYPLQFIGPVRFLIPALLENMKCLEHDHSRVFVWLSFEAFLFKLCALGASVVNAFVCAETTGVCISPGCHPRAPAESHPPFFEGVCQFRHSRRTKERKTSR